jgi:hypothetical protein
LKRDVKNDNDDGKLVGKKYDGDVSGEYCNITLPVRISATLTASAEAFVEQSTSLKLKPNVGHLQILSTH